MREVLTERDFATVFSEPNKLRELGSLLGANYLIIGQVDTMPKRSQGQLMYCCVFQWLQVLDVGSGAIVFQENRSAFADRCNASTAAQAQEGAAYTVAGRFFWHLVREMDQQGHTGPSYRAEQFQDP
jgi:hypothetical protein